MAKSLEESKKLQKKLQKILQDKIIESKNLITLTTNLYRGIPKKDFHKIAGPLCDEWVYQVLNENELLSKVESKDSLSLEDISLEMDNISILIDVKSASVDKENSGGKSSNLTSYRKIREYYSNFPETNFFIVSIEHKAIKNDKDQIKGLIIDGIHIFDFKHIAENELNLNSSMGDQFQIKDSKNVTQVDRTSTELIKICDSKFIKSYDLKKFKEVWTKECSTQINSFKDKIKKTEEKINYWESSEKKSHWLDRHKQKLIILNRDLKKAELNLQNKLVELQSNFN